MQKFISVYLRGMPLDISALKKYIFAYISRSKKSIVVVLYRYKIDIRKSYI